MSEFLSLITTAQLMLTAVAVGAVGALCVAFSRRSRPKPRNVRRVPLESGNTIERRPNVRRPPAATSTVVVRDGVVVSETRSFPLREPCWADDEVTKVGGAA